MHLVYLLVLSLAAADANTPYDSAALVGPVSQAQCSEGAAATPKDGTVIACVNYAAALFTLVTNGCTAVDAQPHESYVQVSYTCTVHP